MSFRIVALLTVAACGGAPPASPENPPATPPNAGEATPAAEPAAVNVPAGTCCASLDGAGAGYPKLPESSPTCDVGPVAEGHIPDGLCALGAAYAAGTLDALGDDAGTARSVAWWTGSGKEVRVNLPAGAAVTHPQSGQIVWPKGDRARLESAFTEAFQAAGLSLVATTPAGGGAEVYGDTVLDFGEASVSLGSDCGGRPGVVCALPSLILPPDAGQWTEVKEIDGSWVIQTPCPPDETRTVKIKPGSNQLGLGVGVSTFTWSKVEAVPRGWSFQSDDGPMTATWVDREAGLIAVQSPELNGTFVIGPKAAQREMVKQTGCEN